MNLLLRDQPLNHSHVQTSTPQAIISITLLLGVVPFLFIWSEDFAMRCARFHCPLFWMFVSDLHVQLLGVDKACPIQIQSRLGQSWSPLSALSPRTQAVICVPARCRPAVRMHTAAIHVTRFPPNSQGLPSVTRPGPYPGAGSDRSDDPPPLHRSTKVHFFRLLIPVGLFVVFEGSIAA